MFAKVFTELYRFVRVALACVGPLLALGCVTPSLNVVPTLPTAPTVPQVERHLTCVLARAMDRHLKAEAAKTPDYALWHHLIEDNFLATINLTLFVTQTQGLNPSLNFITPLTNLGSPIKTIVESSNGTTSVQNATMNTNNLTLAVGFQLAGMQDHNFVETYIVDLRRLYSEMYATPDGVLATCNELDRTDASHGMRYGLKGDLDLEETLESGLEGLQAMPYTPVVTGSAPASKASQQASSASVSQSAGASSFSEKVDFSLLWGINGGPNWILLKFKGPAGGSGASSQLVNYSRQKQDTLISTFAATCKSDEYINLMDPAVYFEPVFEPTPVPQPFSANSLNYYQFYVYKRIPCGECKTKDPTDSADLYSMSDDSLRLHSTEKLIVTIAIAAPPTLAVPKDLVVTPNMVAPPNSAVPSDPAKKNILLPVITYTSTATGTLTVEAVPYTSDPDKQPPVKNATIAWSAFSPGPGQYSLRGIVSDAQSGASVGYMYVSLGPGANLSRISISKNALAAIEAEETRGPIDYWASLPSCSNSGPFLPNGLNVLQQLPGDVSSALQQQR
jgi:hypothetical protein